MIIKGHMRDPVVVDSGLYRGDTHMHVHTYMWIHTVVAQSFSRAQLRHQGLQHARLPCLSPTPGACSNSCLSSWWCHPIVSSPCPPAFNLSQHQGLFQWIGFSSGGQGIGASASVLSMNIQDWFPLGLTGLISLLSFFFVTLEATHEYVHMFWFPSCWH